MNSPDIWDLYGLMIRSRKFEELVQEVWDQGRITGEMHMGIGEEAINVGIVSNLNEEDALALDHRGASPALLRGIDPMELLLEFMGHENGLCHGNGGHMHLFSKSHNLVSSGIVGASAPAAVGFALEMQYHNKNNIAVSFFGEGAMNEGIVMESLNLASIWSLPVLFVCKDSKLAITTESEKVTGGSLLDRAASFGIETVKVDGRDLISMWQIAHDTIESMRHNPRPFFILAECEHRTGHFLGDPLHRSLNAETIGPMIRASVKRKGSNPIKRIVSMLNIVSVMRKSMKQRGQKADPLSNIRDELKNDEPRRERIIADIDKEMAKLRQQLENVGGIQP